MVMPLIQGREEDRHFLNNCAWQHTRVTGAERKEATSLKYVRFLPAKSTEFKGESSGPYKPLTVLPDRPKFLRNYKNSKIIYKIGGLAASSRMTLFRIGDLIQDALVQY